jgi:DNA-directed RNA polymerase subunit K/omega
MTYIPRHKVTRLIPNKFEAIKVAALEARRLNARARTLGVSLPGKITSLAVRRLLSGQVIYFNERERWVELQRERELEAQQKEQEE